MALEIRRKLRASRTAYRIEVKGRLAGPFAVRSGIECHATLADGTEVHVALPEGEVLDDGDLAVASDGRVIEIAATAEPLVQVDLADPAKLAAAAYLLGSAHVPAEIGAQGLRIARGDADDDLLAELGGARTEVEAVFRPLWNPHVHADDHDHHDHAHHHGHDHDHHGHGHGHDHD
jgi:urease accessory protein